MSKGYIGQTFLLVATLFAAMSLLVVIVPAITSQSESLNQVHTSPSVLVGRVVDNTDQKDAMNTASLLIGTMLLVIIIAAILLVKKYQKVKSKKKLSKRKKKVNKKTRRKR